MVDCRWQHVANSPSAILPTYFAFRYLIGFFYLSLFALLVFGGPLASTATIRGVSIFVASWQACTGTCRWLRPATGWSGRGSWYFVFVHSSVFVFVTLLFVFGKSCLMLNAWLCENECVHLPALWTVQLISVWIDSIQFLQLGKHAVRVGKCVWARFAVATRGGAVYAVCVYQCFHFQGFLPILGEIRRKK